MEFKITTNHILKVLQILSWLIFIGLLVEAGSIIVNTVITLFIKPSGVHNFWEGANYLSGLHQFDLGHFVTVAIIMIIVAVLKAIMFYLIVKLFTENKLNIAHPFNTEIRRFILNMSYLAMGIGLFCYSGTDFTEWLTKQGLSAADLQSLGFTGADVWLFMAVILFVIVQIFNRGIEIQNENDLTV